MHRKLLFYITILSFLFFEKFHAQTYQLTGTPVNTTGWTLVSPTTVNTDFIQLTPDLNNQSGSIRLNDPINLKFCDKWRVEFDFRMDSNQTANGDGLAFWYLANPPVASVLGSGLGVSQNAVGLVVGFDTYNNTTTAVMSKVHVAYGQVPNTTDLNNVEFFNTAGSSFHSADLNTSMPFQGLTYKHVEVTGQVNPLAPSSWMIKVTIDGVVICNQSFAPSGAAATMTNGFFGFSASTGGNRSRHSIKNAKIYTDKVPILQPTITQSLCPNPATGSGTVNLTSFNNQFVTTPANYTFTYYVTGSGVPIANPANYQFNANTTISVFVKDNSSLLCDNGDGKIQLVLSPFTANNVTLSTCNNNNSTTGIFDLTTANVSAVTGITKKYYSTLANLTAGTGEITNPTAYVSAPGTVFVKVTTPQGCSGNAQITLNFFALPVANDATLETCFIETAPTTGLFNLTNATVSTQAGVTKLFYTTVANALSGTNEISTPTAYTTVSGDIYVKITGANGCFVIKKITLKVLAPVFSTVLKDKIICIDARTTLDAGPGFASYLWSTGETTQVIQNITVGIYSVKLQTGDCKTTQIVKVIASADPVITGIDITNNTVTVNVSGGSPPYQYSIGGSTFQNSNVFSGLPRGENTVYVKDFYNCSPVTLQFTVPNLINAITPNGDNVNDFVDYSALAYKKNLSFIIYDRYGNKKFEAGKNTNYRWDGTSAGKRLSTGTYWYSITWNESNANNTETKYSGWILVKNRD